MSEFILSVATTVMLFFCSAFFIGGALVEKIVEKIRPEYCSKDKIKFFWYALVTTILGGIGIGILQ